jgi:hypothetical protein
MMEKISVITDPDVSNSLSVDTEKRKNRTSANKDRSNRQAVSSLLAEGGESFFNYVKGLGLSKETELMVLSSNHHYYYDEADLKNIGTLVNIKKLNMIERLGSFLDTLFRILPSNANFIGCFTDTKSLKKNHRLSFYHYAFLNQLINIIDSRTNHYMNRNEVFNLLAANGFKIIDMSEINGITYFLAKSNKPVKLTA